VLFESCLDIGKVIWGCDDDFWLTQLETIGELKDGVGWICTGKSCTATYGSKEETCVQILEIYEGKEWNLGKEDVFTLLNRCKTTQSPFSTPAALRPATTFLTLHRTCAAVMARESSSQS
jgi:hypothetical protein